MRLFHLLTSFSLLMLAAAPACTPRVFPEDDLPLWEERPVFGTFRSDYATVFEASQFALRARYGESAVKIANKQRGLIVSDVFDSGFTSDYIFTNYGGTRIPVDVVHVVQLRLTRSSNRVTVRVTKLEKVRKDVISGNFEFSGNIYELVDVPSSTSKELEILELIGQRLQEQARKRGG